MNSAYEILGVSPSATDDEILAAVRALRMKWHPDKHPEADRDAASRRASEINGAFDKLSSPFARKQYDELLRWVDWDNASREEKEKWGSPEAMKTGRAHERREWGPPQDQAEPQGDEASEEAADYTVDPQPEAAPEDPAPASSGFDPVEYFRQHKGRSPSAGASGTAGDFFHANPWGRRLRKVGIGFAAVMVASVLLRLGLGIVEFVVLSPLVAQPKKAAAATADTVRVDPDRVPVLVQPIEQGAQAVLAIRKRWGVTPKTPPSIRAAEGVRVRFSRMGEGWVIVTSRDGVFCEGMVRIVAPTAAGPELVKGKVFCERGEWTNGAHQRFAARFSGS